ncbi:MAG: ATP-binding cassette domain-containing protein, partial [Treponema sp.]|nr:ATP-binding cassette domain-containing protein [Treponema sp.]
MAEILHIEHLNKTFSVDGKEIQVLKDINLDIEEGEFITIVGHSGCGKSTLLKIIAGLEKHSSGSILREEKPILGPSPEVGMVFQEHRLLPWLKIKDNIGFGLGSLDRKEREEIVQKHIDLVKLSGFEN